MNPKPDIGPAASKPTTHRAILMSTGFHKPTATTHFYVETRACEVRGPNGGPAWEHIYECFRTGAKRRWGLEHRSVPGVKDINGPDPDDDIEEAN